MHLSLRKAGHHIVLANKWPLAVPYPQYLDLWRSGDGFLLHEVTVGAALPIIRTLENLVATGDVIHDITASISGTMGYVTSAIQSGASFSQALSQAAQMGYTEPDPRLDLGGVDARRKALILARKIGEPIDLEDVSVTSLVPPELEKVSLDEFWARLLGEDARLRDLVEEAAGKGEVLRYLANIRPGSAPHVGLVSVPADSVFASTRGTESLFAFSTSRYNEQPLVIRGQGAGGELTAGGVLADILSMRGEQIGMVW
jgi:homoserine dehydrogenase